jgi:hypothetical protein
LKKFFDKVRGNKYVLANKEQKVLKEVQQYTDNIQDRLNHLKAQPAAQVDEVVDSL